MRIERQANALVFTLVEKLDLVQLDIDAMRKKILQIEAECSCLRLEMSSVLKEMDSLNVEKKGGRENVQKIFKEKEPHMTHI